YRTLAESLRHGRFLTFVSEFGRIQDGEPQPQLRKTPWMLGYIRATMREMGVPTARLDGTYQWQVLNATLKSEILGPDGQLAYHRNNAKSAHNIDHLLHVTGMMCFFLTFFVLFLFLLAEGAVWLWRPAWLVERLTHGMPWI